MKAFWDWDQNDSLMNAAENAILGVFTDPTVGSIAPYVIHSVAFGDELGEQGFYWINAMSSFKSRLAPYGIPLTISDDWDRSVWKSGSGLSSTGQQVNSISDLTNAHSMFAFSKYFEFINYITVQPYYHPDQVVDAYSFWPYFQNQLNFLVANNKRPIFVSQTMWSFNTNGHTRGQHDEADTLANYNQYWNTLNAQCPTFRSLKVGWFFHAWGYDEDNFNILGSGSNWKPVFC